VFDELGYRRLTIEHNHRNTKSRRAILRFGFTYEGTFRQADFHRRVNKDLPQYSILNDGKEWPLVRAAVEAWLREENFDAHGQQKRSLNGIRDEIAAGRRADGEPASGH
jgi:hypothetical protein